MIRNSLTLALVAVAVDARSSQHSLKQGTRLAQTGNVNSIREANNEWQVSTGTTDSNGYGFSLKFAYDLALGYTAELLSFVESDQTFLALNPRAFAEAYAEVRAKIHIPIFSAEIQLDLKPFHVAPIDYQAAWNLMEYQDFCQSLSFTREVAQIEVRLATEVYECTTGIYGYLREDKKRDCLWEVYQPMLRAYNRSLFTKYD